MLQSLLNVCGATNEYRDFTYSRYNVTVAINKNGDVVDVYINDGKSRMETTFPSYTWAYIYVQEAIKSIEWDN